MGELANAAIKRKAAMTFGEPTALPGRSSVALTPDKTGSESTLCAVVSAKAGSG